VNGIVTDIVVLLPDVGPEIVMIAGGDTLHVQPEAALKLM
jgi:hypothetical protein